MDKVRIFAQKPLVGLSPELAKTLNIGYDTLQKYIENKETPKKLGRGAFRVVYEINRKYVIKFSRGPENLPNMLEVYTFINSYGKEYHDILAPIVAYDALGQWIIMRRATRIGKIPYYHQVGTQYGKWLCDTHQFNIGAIDMKVKVIDYGQIADDTGNGNARIIWKGSDFTPSKAFKAIFPNYKQGD